MKKLIILFTFIGCLLPIAVNVSANCSHMHSPAAIKAVSLKRLQTSINNISSRKHASSYLQLFGIKKIMGYVVDKKDHDLIIIGDEDSDLPILHLEDFVIALRNAYLKYAPLKKNVYQFSYPGCSIDPRPSVINQLDTIGQKLLQSTGEQQKFVTKWEKICSQPQDVRIMGIPFHTHFANVLVKADYDMKLIVDGSVKIDHVDDFYSLSDMALAQAQDDVINDRPLSISISMNRFWFYPGENIYEEVDGIIMFQKCPVILLTNETYVNSINKIVDGRGPNRYAQYFVNQFSKHYDSIASQRPIYRELENLFRFVALANIIKYKFSDPHQSIHLDYLLEDFPITKETVKHSLPGRSEVKRFTYRKDLPNGYEETHLCLPSCGGVDVKIDVTPNQFRRPKTDILKKIKNAVLKAKPEKSVTWLAKVGHFPSISNSNDKKFLQKINANSETASAIIVKKERTDKQLTYLAIDGNIEIYKGDDPIKLIKKMSKYLKTNNENQKRIISMKGFTEDKANMMKKNFFTQFKKEKINIDDIKSITDNINNYKLAVLFTPGAKLVSMDKPAERKGKISALVHFSQQFRQKLLTVTVKIISNYAVAVKDFLSRTKKLSNSKEPFIIIDKINKFRSQTKKKYNHLKDLELDVRIDIECTSTCFVEIDVKQNNKSG